MLDDARFLWEPLSSYRLVFLLSKIGFKLAFARAKFDFAIIEGENKIYLKLIASNSHTAANVLKKNAINV